MKDNINYPYPQRDLLDQPEYYMYSAYYGKAFLWAYLEQRTEYVAVLEQQYLIKLNGQDSTSLSWLSTWKVMVESSGGVLSNKIQKIHDQFFDSLKEDQVLPDLQPILKLDTTAYIYTEPSLRLLLQCAVEQNHVYRDVYLVWLDRFLKRYEVTKKLYSIYLPSMKAYGDDYSKKNNFALLALTLLYEYEWSGNLKMLNTAIKLGDLLCSMSEKNEEPEVCLAMILAIHKEINLVRQLMTSKGIKI